MRAAIASRANRSNLSQNCGVLELAYARVELAAPTPGWLLPVSISHAKPMAENTRHNVIFGKKRSNRTTQTPVIISVNTFLIPQTGVDRKATSNSE